jgi:hypothetical protein
MRAPFEIDHPSAADDAVLLPYFAWSCLSFPLATRATIPLPTFANTNLNFARDLQELLGILALLTLSAPFRICKLHIPLATRETDLYQIGGPRSIQLALKLQF